MKKELEIVSHATMRHLEVFLVEMTARNPHGHSDLEIGVILNGNVTLFADQERVELRKGDIYLVNRYQVHSFAAGKSPAMILAFQIHADLYRDLNYQMTFLRLDEKVIRSGPLHDALFTQLWQCAEIYFGERPFRELECASILLHTLYLLLEETPYTMTSEREYRTAQHNARRINRITDYIAKHYRERISLEDIAALENITTYHASHCMKNAFGISFQEYLNTIRLEAAVRLLRQTDLNLLDICLETGFSSSRYLNRTIQKTFGCTAKEYRKNPQAPPQVPSLPASDLQRRYTFEQAAAILYDFL